MSISDSTLALPLLDEARIHRLKMTDGDLTFFVEMIGLFDVRSAELLAEINAEAQAGTYRIKPHLHKLKGICFSLGAQRLAEVCKEMEVLTEKGFVTDNDITILQQVTRQTREAQQQLL